jgi:hypothetical protein
MWPGGCHSGIDDLRLVKLASSAVEGGYVKPGLGYDRFELGGLVEGC